MRPGGEPPPGFTVLTDAECRAKVPPAAPSGAARVFALHFAAVIPGWWPRVPASHFSNRVTP